MAGYLSEAGREAVTAAVTEAELGTSGEIVTVLADRSDGYTDVALLWSVAVSFTAMAAFTAFPRFYLGLIERLTGGWTIEWTLSEVLTIVTAIGLIKFLAMWALQAWQPLRFVLVPGPVKHARVRARAVSLFRVGADRRTQGRTGVLIYLSMREHRAEIVTDEAIAAKVPAEVWGAAMADMLAEIRHGRVAEGLCAGIRDVGAVLAEQFPRAADDINEIPDRLIEV